MSLRDALGLLPAWMRQAACLDEPSRWWLEPGHDAVAVAVCARCDVQPECLAHALVHREEVGIWGGKTEHEREEIIRAAARSSDHA